MRDWNEASYVLTVQQSHTVLEDMATPNRQLAIPGLRDRKDPIIVQDFRVV